MFIVDSFVCGSIHWKLRDEDDCVNSICSFTFENEHFSRLSLPPRYNEDHVSTLTVFEGFAKLYEPLIFLNNGLILMMHYREFVVCYDTRRKLMEVIRICQTQGNNYAIAYKPSFVSLKDVGKGEQVKMSR
ncbi:hypothetical protein Peur_004744 [Populus x canadensis]